jgi:hypothetical protein
MMHRESAPSLEQATTCDIVQDWLSANSARLGRQISMSRRTTAPLKLNAEYETSSLMISITAWDHARCLDIAVMGKTTKDVGWLAAGPCPDNAALLARLGDLAKALDLPAASSVQSVASSGRSG